MLSNAIQKLANLMAFWAIQYREALNTLEKPIDQNREPIVFDHAVVELFGHRRIEGTVTRIGHGAATLYRVVNERSDTIVSPKSIYAITEGESAPDSEPPPSHGRAVSAEGKTEEEGETEEAPFDWEAWHGELRSAIEIWAESNPKPIGLNNAWDAFKSKEIGASKRLPNFSDVAVAVGAINAERQLT